MVEEELLVLRHRLDDLARVRAAEPLLLVDRDHLLDLAERVVLELPALARALDAREVDLRLGAEEVADAHRERVRDEVRDAEQQHVARRLARAGDGAHDREGRDDAI